MKGSREGKANGVPREEKERGDGITLFSQKIIKKIRNKKVAIKVCTVL